MRWVPPFVRLHRYRLGDYRKEDIQRFLCKAHLDIPLVSDLVLSNGLRRASIA